MTEELQSIFVSKGITLSSAESCTGGNIAHQITLRSGSSEYFNGTVVSYLNDVKSNVLGVSKQDLIEFGAVSQPVAIQMAEGVRKLMKTDYSVSTTGIAGPTGGVPGKPVGTVWVGLSGPNGTIAQRHHFKGNREEVISQTTQTVLKLITNLVKEED